MTPSIEQRRKKFLWMTAAFLGIFLCIFFITAYQRFSSVMTFEVTARARGIGDYKKYHLPGHDYFVYGTEGKLYWKPRTMLQAVVLSCINNKGVDLFDIAGLAITASIIYYMFMDSKDNAPFTKKMAVGFGKLLLVLVFTDGLCQLARSMLAINYITHITNGQFTMYMDYKVISYNYLALLLVIPFLSQIPYFGLDLQKEQELTI